MDVAARAPHSLISLRRIGTVAWLLSTECARLDGNDGIEL